MLPTAVEIGIMSFVYIVADSDGKMPTPSVLSQKLVNLDVKMSRLRERVGRWTRRPADAQKLSIVHKKKKRDLETLEINTRICVYLFTAQYRLCAAIELESMYNAVYAFDVYELKCPSFVS